MIDASIATRKSMLLDLGFCGHAASSRTPSAYQDAPNSIFLAESQSLRNSGNRKSAIKEAGERHPSFVFYAG